MGGGIFQGKISPCHVIADQTESSYSSVGLHDSTKGRLCVLCHGVGFIEYDDFVGWTWIRLSIGCDGLCSRRLSCEVLDLVSYYGDASFV